MDNEHDSRNNAPDASENNGENKAASAGDATTPTKTEEKSFPRIQIKTPSKLAQEFSEKQKQLDDQNRTNSAKPASDINTTPLYDEPNDCRQANTFDGGEPAASAPQPEVEINADNSADQ